VKHSITQQAKTQHKFIFLTKFTWLWIKALIASKNLYFSFMQNTWWLGACTPTWLTLLVREIPKNIDFIGFIFQFWALLLLIWWSGPMWPWAGVKEFRVLGDMVPSPYKYIGLIPWNISPFKYLVPLNAK